MIYAKRDWSTASLRPRKTPILNQTRRKSRCKNRYELTWWYLQIYFIGNIKENNILSNWCNFAQKNARPSTTNASFFSAWRKGSFPVWCFIYFVLVKIINELFTSLLSYCIRNICVIVFSKPSMNMLKVVYYFSVSLQQFSHSACHMTCPAVRLAFNTWLKTSEPLILLSAVVNVKTLEKMSRNFTTYPTVAPKIRVYGDTVFKFNSSSFTSKSGESVLLNIYLHIRDK